MATTPYPLLSYPFRMLPNWTAATNPQGSPQANDEQVGVICRTIEGEREMAPGFGLPDPAFSGISAIDVASQVALYGPAVTVTSVTAEPGPANTQTITIEVS